jgi:molybdopterin-guanine dinucleotide biosynthesis protein A
MTVSDATFAIIAGGRARRLGGVPKGLLRFDERPIIETLLRSARPFAGVLMVTDDPEPYRPFGLRTVRDVVPNRGAPGGVHSALVHAATPWVFAVGCDMPFVTQAAVDGVLAERGDDVDVVAFHVGGRLEPLLAAYRSSLAERWAAALAEEPSFHKLIQGFRARLLPEERLWAVDPDGRALVSINSPEDLARWGGALPGFTPGPP